jgi:two-component system, NarL family, response regulator LiaR
MVSAAACSSSPFGLPNTVFLFWSIRSRSAASFSVNDQKVRELGITPRELEILQLIANGMSTREIAGSLFVSENTVKTHSSRLFDKLNVNRRTKAVQVGKTLGLIP